MDKNNLFIHKLKQNRCLFNKYLTKKKIKTENISFYIVVTTYSYRNLLIVYFVHTINYDE